MKRIALVGLGRMGSAMASRLLARNYELTVYNRTPGKTQALVSKGQTWMVEKEPHKL